MLTVNQQQTLIQTKMTSSELESQNKLIEKGSASIMGRVFNQTTDPDSNVNTFTAANLLNAFGADISKDEAKAVTAWTSENNTGETNIAKSEMTIDTPVVRYEGNIVSLSDLSDFKADEMKTEVNKDIAANWLSTKGGEDVSKADINTANSFISQIKDGEPTKAQSESAAKWLQSKGSNMDAKSVEAVFEAIKARGGDPSEALMMLATCKG